MADKGAEALLQSAQADVFSAAHTHTAAVEPPKDAQGAPRAAKDFGNSSKNMPKGMRPCLICQTPTNKYKFPCCRMLYCSKDCYAQHQAAGPCQVKQEREAQTKKRLRREEDLLGGGRRRRGNLDADVPDNTGKAKGSAVSDNIAMYLTSSPDAILSARQLNQVKQDPKVRGFLRSRALRLLFKRIITARDKTDALERALARDPGFIEVIDAIMDAALWNPDA